ncbi:BamA/TamA family outer membrane protein [Parabacteroides johnsonii]|uniref:BamA/TamA family outer membrane protein n=1 Tax=Parabacteroides johnsonii TaxID=387661 RepID=UPI002431FE50|nr:BamA/TamA family outer membrane protein [Parabacteroides johnsonii]MBS6225038.1 BamA/TamA family outer membrane protein [Parabacteroides johnsonii]
MLKYIIVFAGASLLTISLPAKAQEQRDIVALSSEEIMTPSDTVSRKETVIVDGVKLNEKQLKRYYRQLRKDSIRAHKNVWWSVLGGPSYTPEASFGVGGAVLASFRMNKQDTISQRSFLPAGLNLSINGTIVVAGAGTFFFNENRFRIYMNYGYRNEPSHYYGKGFEKAETIERGDSTTRFHRSYFQLYPRFVWEVRPHFYLGGLFDLNYTKVSNVNSVMEKDPYFQQFKRKYFNVGIGGLIQYDTRDDVATPTRGMLLGANFKLFGKYLGGAYNYEIIELEYRQFKNIFRPRSTLAWIAKSQIGLGDVPFTELPTFGSPFDLRGYYMGKYRDKSMAYGIVEYRHMFGSPAKYKSGNFWAKCGFVAWVGTGTIGETPFDWNKWKLNFGAGLRFQMQPGKNFRLDIGKEPGQPGMQVYMNMTEAF